MNTKQTKKILYLFAMFFYLFIHIFVVVILGFFCCWFCFGWGRRLVGFFICLGENEVFTKHILPDIFTYLDKSYFLACLQLIGETEEWDRFLLSSVRMNIDTDL